MTRVELFKKLIVKAEANGYTGPTHLYELGRILDGTNYYAIIFREDFSKAIWGQEVFHELYAPSIPSWVYHSGKLLFADDKFKYMEDNLKFD